MNETKAQAKKAEKAYQLAKQVCQECFALGESRLPLIGVHQDCAFGRVGALPWKEPHDNVFMQAYERGSCLNA